MRLELVARNASLNVSWPATRCDNGKPRPAGILVAGLANVRVAFQRLPTAVAGHARNMRDIPPQLEQARHAVMAQIVEVQPQLCWHLFRVDSDRVARPRERRRLRPLSTENPVAGPGLGADDVQRLWRQVAPYIVAGLLAGVLHVAHHDARVCFLEIRPQ